MAKSRGKGKMYVGINAWGRAVAVPADVRRKRARLWGGLRNAGTWGALEAALDPRDYRKVLEMVENDEEAPPDPGDEFHIEMISAFHDCDYPPGLDTVMGKWLSGVDLAGIARGGYNMLQQTWLHIDGDDLEELIARLEAAGYEVVADPSKIREADY